MDKNIRLRKQKKINKTKKKILGGNIDTINSDDVVMKIPNITGRMGASIITNIPKITMFDFIATELNHDHLLVFNDGGANRTMKYGHLKENLKLYDFTSVSNENSQITDTCITNENTLSNNFFIQNGIPMLSNIDKGIDDEQLRACMFCYKYDSVFNTQQNFNVDLYKLWYGGATHIITEHVNSPTTYIISSLFKNKTGNFLSKCSVFGYKQTFKTNTKHYKDIFEKMDNINSNNKIKDYFITNDACGEIYNNLTTNNNAIHLVDHQFTKYYRCNMIFAPVHLCDQMTNPKCSSIQKNLSNTSGPPRTKNLSVGLYIDNEQYITENIPSIALKYKVTSEAGVIKSDYAYGKRVITTDNNILPNTDTLKLPKGPPLFIDDLNTKNIIIDETSGIKNSAGQLRTRIKNSYTNSEYVEHVTLAQIKRLGDYSQIAYSYELPKLLRDPILNTSNNKYTNKISNANMGTMMNENKKVDDPLSNYGEGTSDLIDLLNAASTEDDKIKVLRKRILHVAGDLPAFCWCAFNRINVVYFKADEALACIFDYEY
jgi:hypothetical protein